MAVEVALGLLEAAGRINPAPRRNLLPPSAEQYRDSVTAIVRDKLEPYIRSSAAERRVGPTTPAVGRIPRDAKVRLSGGCSFSQPLSHQVFSE